MIDPDFIRPVSEDDLEIHNNNVTARITIGPNGFIEATLPEKEETEMRNYRKDMYRWLTDRIGEIFRANQYTNLSKEKLEMAIDECIKQTINQYVVIPNDEVEKLIEEECIGGKA